MSNPAEEPDVPEVPAEPEDVVEIDELVGELVDDPMVAEEDKE